MSKILRYLACLFMLIFVGNALAAGYSCPTYKKYTSCNSGYYISNCGSTWNGQTISSSSLTTGNSCVACPSGYTCTGGLVCPKASTVTITLNKNGGTGTCGGASSTTAGSVSCTPGSSCTLPSWNSSTCSMTNGSKIFKGWSTSSTATSGVTTITPSAAATYYAVWVTPTCSATNGSCSITTPSSNAPRATITCNTGYSQSGGTNTTTSFTATGTAGATTVSGACSARSYTCSAGQYLNGATCTSCTSPYYCIGGTWTYNGGAQGRSSCSSLSGVSPSGGTYSSVSPYNASTTCRYKAPSKTITGCSTVTSNTVSYSGSAWPASTYSVTADGGYIISGNNTSSATCTQCDAGEYSAGGSATSCSTCANWTYSSAGASSCTSCLSVESGWTKASGTGWTSYTSCKETKAATSVSSYCTAGQLTKTQSSASAWGTASVSVAFQADEGAYVTGSGASTTCSNCSSGSFCEGGTSAPESCPSGYPNSAAGASLITQCYSNTKRRAWTGSQVNGSVPANCAAVTSWNACSKPSCSYVAYSNSAGTGDGTIKSGCSTNNANCTKTADTTTGKTGYYGYSNGTGQACSTCPSGYPNSDNGASAITKCYSDTKSRAWTGSQTACTKPTGCYSVQCTSCSNPACSYVAYSNSTGTADGTIKSGCSTNNESCQQSVGSVTANAGRYVSGLTCPACGVGTFQSTNGSTATSCSVCSGNTYAASQGTATCSSCPTSYTISGTTAADHDAKSDCKISCSAGTQVVSADAACTTPADSWYSAAHTVAAGSTSGTNVKSCLTNYYTPDTTTQTDHDSSTDCKISCSAGTRVVSANATSCTTPSGNWYIGAHSVSQGSTSSVNSCLTNYTITGTAATNHDAASDCKISCSGGAYIAAANDTSCEDVGAGYWAAASTVSQGSAGVRNACDAGLTTIGSGAGADEAGDCGRVLNVNGEKIYLRSDKKTTPSLNVSISGKTFYGNMGTSTVGSLKIKSSGTTYSVYDDSMK